MSPTTRNRLLLAVAGLGGLLYGVDVGIIAGALPYLEATSNLSASQLSFIVAAVLLGSVISTLFAGLLSDLLGRKSLMLVSGLLFVASIPVIALSGSYGALITGRLLQGISAGFIGVVVPLYLAEILDPSQRGRGTGLFQWMLTLGIVSAAIIGMAFSFRVGAAEKLGDATHLFEVKDNAWRSIFWASLPPGILFVLGCCFVPESPRWLRRRSESADAVRSTVPTATRESLWQRKYLIPFALACTILACNQATGVNSIIGYNTTILLQSGLSDLHAHWGYVILTSVNFLVTLGAVALVDRKGRKFLLSLGSAGIIVCLVFVAFLFRQTEQQRLDVAPALQALARTPDGLDLTFDSGLARTLAPERPGPQTLVVIYRYGDYRSATPAVRSDTQTAIHISRDVLPGNAVSAFFSRPFGDLTAARQAPLQIEHALLTPVPPESHGWLIALGIFGFMAFFAIGPGVCVWLALSELMPTRIRSNGMSVALLINQVVSTVIAGVFLPTVGRFGYSTLFFAFAGCTVIYFLTARLFLPETKGRSLEEIEAHFARRR